MSPKAEAGSGPAPPPAQEVVQDQLTRILASAAFQSSPCCSAFLRYIVERTLEGRLDMLRERQLGIEVFGRDPAYDTSEDSRVRVRATDVRKRLGQYYAGREEELQIRLPKGSYVPEFIPPAMAHPGAAAPDLPATAKRARFASTLRWLLVIALLAGALLAFRGVWLTPVKKTALDDFWAPVVSSRQKQVVLSVGRHTVYDVAWKISQDYFKTHPYPPGPPPYSLPRDADLVLRGTDLLPEQGLFVGVGVADTMLCFASFLTRHGKGCYLRAGTNLTFEELREHPTILIGALSNYWTMHFTRDLRFHFAESGPDGVIVDGQDPGRVFVSRVELPGSPSRQIDYGMACRLRTESGEPIIVAAGLLQWGCQGAATLLTEPSLFATALRRAPPGWEKKNIQVILRVDVVNTTVGAPEVIDAHFW